MIKDDVGAIKPALEAARKAFETHKTKENSFRKQQLSNFIKGLREMNTDIEEALSKDLGYTPFTSLLLSQTITISEIEYLRNNFEKWTKPRECDTPILVGPGKSYVYPEPFGVALVIGAWNYPFYTSLPQCAAAISAGNCKISKIYVPPH